MKTNSKQRVEINLDELHSLREGVRNAYETRNPQKKLRTPNNKDSPYYDLLKTDMGKVVTDPPSESTMNDFFNDDRKVNFQIQKLESIKRYIVSANLFSSRSNLFSNEQNNIELKSGIENKLLQCYQKKAEVVIKNLDEYELIHLSLNENEIGLLEKLQPLQDCMPNIHWDYIKHRLTVNKNIIRGLKIITPIEEIIIGFYILYPVNRQCVELMDSGKILKSDQFELKHITDCFDIARGIYISIVYGLDYYSRAVILMKLFEELRNILKENENIKKLYTRPVSVDGLRNAVKNNFQKMDNSEIYFLNFN